MQFKCSAACYRTSLVITCVSYSNCHNPWQSHNPRTMQWQLCSSFSHQSLRQCQTKATTAILTAYSPSKCYHSGGKFIFECLTHAKQCHHFGMIGEHLNAVKFISTRSINNKNFTIFCSINLDNKLFCLPTSFATLERRSQ